MLPTMFLNKEAAQRATIKKYYVTDDCDNNHIEERLSAEANQSVSCTKTQEDECTYEFGSYDDFVTFAKNELDAYQNSNCDADEEAEELWQKFLETDDLSINGVTFYSAVVEFNAQIYLDNVTEQEGAAVITADNALDNLMKVRFAQIGVNLEYDINNRNIIIVDGTVMNQQEFLQWCLDNHPEMLGIDVCEEA